MKFKEALQHFNLSTSMATVDNIETAFRGQSAMLTRRIAEANNDEERARIEAEIQTLKDARAILISAIQARTQAASPNTDSSNRKPLILVVALLVVGVILWLLIPSSAPPQQQADTNTAAPIQDVTPSDESLALNNPTESKRVDISATDFELESKLESPEERQIRSRVRKQIREVKQLVDQWNEEFAQQGFSLPEDLSQTMWQARNAYDTSAFSGAEQSYNEVITQLEQLLSNAQAASQQYQQTLASKLQWTKLAQQRQHSFPQDKQHNSTLYTIKQRLSSILPSDIDTLKNIADSYSAAIAQSDQLVSAQQRYTDKQSQWQASGGDIAKLPAAIQTHYRRVDGAINVNDADQLAMSYDALITYFNTSLAKPAQAVAKPAPKLDPIAQDIQRVVDESIRYTNRISTGSYFMGGADAASPMGKVHFPVASPPHRVKVKSFRMSLNEVPFDHFDVFAKAVKLTRPDDNGWGRGNRPVINVSHADATAYAQWLSKESGRQFRLPSESEWEYVAWANNNEPENWKNRLDKEGANCKGCSTEKPMSVPVSQHHVNGWGVRNMSGNVAEWTLDCWNTRYDGAPSSSEPWLSGDCSQKVIRGGSWDSDIRYVHPAFRTSLDSSARNATTGFRLVLEK